jgi:hypothetical protein
MSRYTLICSLLLLLVSNGYLQQRSAAKLIDVFGEASCEDLRMRVLNLYKQTSDQQGSIGFVVVNPQTDKLSRAIQVKKLVEITLRLSKLDLNKIRVVRGRDSNRLEVRMWIAEPGSNEPSYESASWPEESYDLSKPFVYGATFVDEVCPTFVPELYADLIKSNPDIHGRVVVYPYPGLSKWELAEDWINILTKEYGVPRNRLSLYFGKPSYNINVEFWIVPLKKR